MRVSTLATIVAAIPLGLAGGPDGDLHKPRKPANTGNVDGAPKIVHSHFQKVPKHENSSIIDTPLDQFSTPVGMLWAVNVSIGNPPQNVTLALE